MTSPKSVVLASSVDMLRVYRGTLSRCLGVAVIGWMLGSTELAAAQSDEQRAAARSIATQGADAFNRGRFQEAADLFGRAETLMHAPPHLLFLGRSQEKLGQLVKARESYLKITREVLSETAPPAFREAQLSAERELKSLEPRIASLAITLEPTNVTEVSVRVDGAPIPAVLVGVQRPMDPGEHKIEVSAPGFRVEPQVVRLRDGEKRSVLFRLQPDAAAAVRPTQPLPAPAGDEVAPLQVGMSPELQPAPAAPTSEAASGTSGLRIGSYAAFGVGAVGLGIGTIFLLSSKSKRADADAAFEQCAASGDCRENDPEARRTAELDDSARSAMTLSIVGFAVGGVGVAAGTALFLASSGDDKEHATLQPSIRPWVGLGSAGVSGRF